MAAMKRMEVEGIERNRAKYAGMDALQVEAVVTAAAEVACISLLRHFPNKRAHTGIDPQFYAELYTFIEGQLDRKFAG